MDYGIYSGLRFDNSFGIQSLPSFTFDTDALAYFNANTAITLDADKLAIDAFYKGLKADGIYTKIRFMYLPLWSSAASNKWNLVNPVDSVAAFRLAFYGGWTHSSTGADPNGTTGYADTFFTPTTWDNEHLVFYSGENTATATAIDIGVISSASNRYFLSNGLSNTNSPNAAFGNPILSSTGSAEGFFCTTVNGTTGKIFKDATQIDADTITGSGPSFGPVHIGRGNGINYYSNREFRFASNGTYLTDTEVSNFYSRVQTLLTHFGINV